MAELHQWDVAAANNNSAAPDGFPENMPYGDVNNAAREVMAVLRRWLGDNSGVLVSGGTANAQTLTPNGTYSAYADGLSFVFEAGATNTGDTTLNVSGIGAATTRKLDPSTGTFIALAAGDLTAGQIYRVVYDSANTRFVVVNPSDLTRVRQRLSSTTATSLVSTAHALQIGADDTAANLAFDRAGLQARDNGAAVALEVQRSGGNLIVGPSSGQRLIALPSGIQSDNAGSPATLALNASGGTTTHGGSGTFAGSLSVTGNASVNGTLTVTNTITATNGISSPGAITTTGATADIDSNRDIIATRDAIVGNDLTVMGDATLPLVNGIAPGDREVSVHTSGAGPTSSNRHGCLLFTSAGSPPYTFTLDDDATLGAPYSATLGQNIMLVNNSGAVLGISGVATIIGATSVPDGASAIVIHVATDTWAVHLGS